ncbi:hypothetical protein IMCC26134_05980 [Verrucomicrobia bacterium IMCC26134]|jgi:hypothetical protein|nr:hypothetical protein IMCC26134_05980 [Verrucomicrobia bacterium IMCC26134]
MKTLSPVLALCFASVLSVTAAYADDAGTQPAKPTKAPCGCELKADGKVCGTDTDCCCTGEKAKATPEAKKPSKNECPDAKHGDKCDVDTKADGAKPAKAKSHQ